MPPRITFTPPRIPLFFLGGESDMREIGEVVLRTNMDRAMLAINSLDVAAKPLTVPYARRKQRLGRPAIRNLQLDGSMWANAGLVELDEFHVAIAFHSGVEQIKANVNQLIDPFFGVSPSDDEKVSVRAQELTDEKVAQFNRGG